MPIYTYIFQGSLGNSTVQESVTFEAETDQVSNRAWEALLASGAYDRGEHYAPIKRTILISVTRDLSSQVSPDSTDK